MNDCRENISNRLWRNLAWVTEKKTEADVRLPSPGHCRENNSWLCESCPGLRVGAWFCCAIIQYLLDDFSIGEKLKTRWIFFLGGWSCDKLNHLFSNKTSLPCISHKKVQMCTGYTDFPLKYKEEFLKCSTKLSIF